jgi:hypothetical protein
MCGRYDNLISRDAYATLFRAGRIPRSNFPPRYKIAPTDQIPIVRIDPRDGERELVMARWRSFPFGGKRNPRLPTSTRLLRRCTSSPYFARLSPRDAASFQRPAFMSGSSATTGSSPIGFDARISSPSPLPGSGNSRGSVGRRSFQPLSSLATPSSMA